MSKFVYTQPYVIISAFIVKESKLLLIQENQPPDIGKWNIPGGKLEFGEDPIVAVKREAYEESGLDFKPTGILGVTSIYREDVPVEPRPLHIIKITYVGEVSGEVSLEHGDTIDGVEEISAYKWLTFKEVHDLDIKELRYKDIKTLLNKYQQNKILPLDSLEHITQKLEA